MNSRTSRRPSVLLAIATTALVAVGGLLVPAAANAESGTGDVAAATLDWGVKSSFRNYVSGPIAHGTIKTVGDVTGSYVWSGGAGTAAMDASSAAIAFGSGDGVQFQGHPMDGGYALDLTFTQPQVIITSATSAKLLLDVTGREFVSMTEVGPAFTLDDVSFADITLPAPTQSGDTYTWSDATVTLTEAGAEAFGGFYPAGTSLDALTLSAPVTAPVAPAAQTTTTLKASPAAPKSGDEVTLTATVAPQNAAGTITFRDGENSLGSAAVNSGSATLKTTALTVGEHSLTASFEPDDAAAFLASSSTAVALTVSGDDAETPDPQWQPSVEVFLADGVTPLADSPVYDGDTLVVKGSGFDPEANIGGRGMPVPANLPQGDYVVFGSFAEQWQPSTGAPSSTRAVSAQQWALTADTLAQVPESFRETIRKQWVELKADGTFTATLTAAAVEADAEAGQYGVYTYAAGGMKNAEQEIAVAVDYRGERPTEPEKPSEEPELEVFTGSDSAAQPGDTVSFVAKGLADGQTVRFEVHSDDAVDAGTATADSSGIARVAWTVPADFAEGDHEVHVFRVDENGVSEASAFLIGSLEVTAASIVPTDPNNPTDPETDEPTDIDPDGKTETENPDKQVCVARSVTSGTLTWGLKQSFRSYIEGPIAKGEFTGGSFRATAGSLNTDAGDRGQIRFSGSITATGHDGLLDLQVSSPRIVLNGDGTGSLYAHVRSTDATGALVTDATVRLAALSFQAKSTGSSFALDGAAATLTAAGATAFAGFYDAGTSLDAVSLQVALGGTTECDIATDPDGSSLATTGSDVPVFGIAFSMMLMLAGGALVVARRRMTV